MTADEWLDEQRSNGWRYSATTPSTVLPERVEDDAIEARSAVLIPGFRTWLFRTEGDMREFRQTYGVASA